MVHGVERLRVIADGPPRRDPRPVTPDTTLRGHRVIVNADGGEWVGDLRAVDEPYWFDETTYVRWLPGDVPPDGGDPARARLFVAACTERDWYEWARTRRRPEVVEYPAYLVWVE